MAGYPSQFPGVQLSQSSNIMPTDPYPPPSERAWHAQAQTFLQTAGQGFQLRKSDLKWRCDICDVKTRNEPDWLAHLASKEHLKKVREREQCAVLVLGLPEEAGPATVQRLLKDFQLPCENITFVPPGEPECEGEAFWHVQLQSVDEARRAVKTPEATIDGYQVTLTLAIHPFRCTICNMSLNSSNQLQQHLNGSKHKEVLKQHVAQCGLMLAGVPLHATEDHIRQLFGKYDIAEGGILMIGDCGLAPMQTVYVTFNSIQDADRAFQLQSYEPTILGSSIRILRRCDTPPVQEAELSISGEKTPEEVYLLARSLLQSKKMRDVSTISPSTFGRIFTFYLSSKPPALPGVLPKDRFFEEFDVQAGGKQGMVTMDQALTIIKPLEQDFNFTLPRGVTLWLHDKLSKYCKEPKDKALSKGTFVQIRNLKCHAYQATAEIMKGLQLNQIQPPPVVQFPYQRRFPPQHARQSHSSSSQGFSSSHTQAS